MGDMWNKHEEQLGRGLTYDLWKNFPTHEIFTLKDANVGYGCILDVANPPYAKEDAGAYATGGNGVRMWTDSTEIIRGITWDEGGPAVRFHTDSNNGASEAQWCGGGEPFIISDTGADAKELIFEVQFRVSSVTANDMGLFIGLAGTHAMDGDFLVDDVGDKDAIADIDLIGLFRSHPDTTGLDINYQIAGTAATAHEADWKTIVANTWYIFGMRYIPLRKIDFYWGTGDRTTTKVAIDDNPITSIDIAAADFPDGQGLAPVIAVKGGTTNAEYLDIRTFACAQLSKAAN